MDLPVEDFEIHLYADGHLSAARQAFVEAYLRHHPETAARVGDYRRQNEQMRQLFAGVAEAPPSIVEERLARQLQHRLGRTRLSVYWRPVLASAAAVVLAASLGAGVTEVFDAHNVVAPEPVPSFAETAARLHTFYAGAEPTEFGADSAAKLNTLLDKRLGAPLKLPDLTPKGFTLLGGRVLPSPGGAAAQLVYRDQAGRLVTLFLGAPVKPQLRTEPTVERKDLSLYTWSDGPIGVAVVGGLSHDELRGIAEVAQRSLLPPANNPRPDDHPPGPPAKEAHDGSSRT
jgi:anti-sigma factor RsiW